MNKDDIKRAYHAARNARLKLENALEAAPPAVRMEYRDKYKADNPNRIYSVRLKGGITATRHKPAVHTPRLDAQRLAIMHCNVMAEMIRRGVA